MPGTGQCIERMHAAVYVSLGMTPLKCNDCLFARLRFVESPKVIQDESFFVGKRTWRDGYHAEVILLRPPLSDR